MNKKVVKNASWIIGCKIAQSILAFFISMLSARYLGPSNFGLVGYAQSVTVFMAPIMQMGFNYILVREIINHKEEEGKIIGSSILVSVISSIGCMIAIFLFAFISSPNDKDSIIVCVLYSISLIFQAGELVAYWYQAHYLSKYPSLVSFFAYTIVSAYKVFLLSTEKSVYWFAVSYAIDYCIIAFVLIILFKCKSKQKLEFSLTVAKRLISNGKYYILSALMINVFLQTDRIMVKMMVGNSEAGYYIAASTCTGLLAFVFAAINDSMRPLVLENKKNRSCLYEKSIISLYSIIIYLALIYAMILCAFSNTIVRLLYGVDYVAAVPILQVLSWYTVFAYYGGAKDVWVLAEEKQKYLIYLNGAGAIANVTLNFFLIKTCGGVGAAIASLITQMITNVLIVQFIPDLRPNNRFLLLSLNPRNLMQIMKLGAGRLF